MAPAQNVTIEHLNKLAIHHNTIIMGDLNGKNKLWGSPFNDIRGNKIECFLEANDLVCINKGQPTHLNYNGTVSHLDLIICSNNLAFNTDCNVMDETWGSDHFPIEVAFANCIPNFFTSSDQNLNLGKANWPLFKSQLQNLSLFDSNIDELDSCYDKFVSEILLARDIAVPKRSYNFKHKYTPYWNKDCSEAKKKKKNAAKALRKNKSLNNQIYYKECKKSFKKIILKQKQLHWEKICERINYKTKIADIWKKSKFLMGPTLTVKLSLPNLMENLKKILTLLTNSLIHLV